MNMKKNNYIIYHLIYSPYLPVLLGLILFIILRSFDPIMLCQSVDNESIEQLNTSLESEMSKLKDVTKEQINWSNLYHEKRAKLERHKDMEEYLANKAIGKFTEAEEIITKIKSIENNIRKLDSSYEPCFNKTVWEYFSQKT